MVARPSISVGITWLTRRPPVRWGIVSNIVSFRLYERDSTKRAYEHFTLKGLRDKDEFARFFVLFRRQGLIEPEFNQPPLAVRLIQETNEKQREVSDKLYELYSTHRFSLIQDLISKKFQAEMAIEMAQRLSTA